MNRPRHLQLCDGLDMRICHSCARCVANNPSVIPERTIVPVASPPRCVDWTAMPRMAADVTHGSL